MSDSPYDIIVFGATSFVGAILTDYLVETYGVNEDISWAVAGRSQSKLQSLKSALGEKAKDLPLIIADACSDSDMAALCQKTRVVVSTVGPYALYGESLIKACCETGTDYVDLTGEAHWVRRMLDLYEERASASGARIVPSCGFDSIPSDMGVWYLQRRVLDKYGQNCNEVTMRVKAAKGGASGGTIASMLNLVKEASKDKELRRELSDPYSICPAETEKNPDQGSINSARKDQTANSWIAPFAMAAINERVVLRSNALAKYADHFSYNEAILTGPGVAGALAANAIVAGMGAFMLGVVIPPTRLVMEKFVLPEPGEGPSPEAQRNGYYDLRFFGTTAVGHSIKTKVTGDRDPGYGSTAKMLAEAALCLAVDISKDEKGGGFWTPATAMADKLLKRLTDNAGLTFTVLE